MSAPSCAAAPTPTPIVAATTPASILADSDAATLSEPLSADRPSGVQSSPCTAHHTSSSLPAASLAPTGASAASSATVALTTVAAGTVAAVPTETHFASREELLSYVHAFALRNGYAVVIHKSNVPRGQVWLGCDLGGSYRPLASADGTRKRKCSSRLQNCPFQLYARRLPDSQWLLKVQHAAHNHDIGGQGPEQLVAHPIARRLTLAQKQLVDELTTLGARPAHILETLKEQFPDKPIKVQDIYNTRNYIRRERSAGRVPFANELGDVAPPPPPQQQQQLPTFSASGGSDAVVEAAGPSGLPSLALGVTERPLALPVDGLATEPSASESAADGPASAAATAAPALSTELLQLDAASAPSLSRVSTTTDLSRFSSSAHAAVSAIAVPSASPARARERLETLLSDVHTRFADWQPRTQSQFLFQLDVLVRKCRKSDARAVASLESSVTCATEPGAEALGTSSSDAVATGAEPLAPAVGASGERVSE